MHVVAPRAVAQPHVRADENARTVEGVASVGAPTVVERRVAPSSEGQDVAGDRRQPRDGHELRARDMEVRTAKAMQEPDGSVDLLPSYEYAVGPDGLPYVIGQGESVAPPEAPPPLLLEDEDEAAPVEREPIARESVEREPIEREPVAREATKREAAEREPAAPADDHVTRSYAKLVEPERLPRLDTIA